ncbi:tellurite resistance/C4-dicarboxylate transporter family protein [Streptomyces sp. NPDC091272]|uniref:tellurite resistance/C4-dicarboxylate transporter family protein n=1 Tax=Streptomyces sp. NPDC091272 TaxID=3365981 RepID=UPI00381E08B6
MTRFTRAAARAAGGLDALPPAAGAVVMASAILSVGLHLLGARWASAVLFCLGLGAWSVLAAVFGRHLLYERNKWRQEADTPPALTTVAATAVLGTRIALFGNQPLSVTLLCASVLLWPLLMVHVLRHWEHKVPGAAYLVCVATQAIVVLACVVAGAAGMRWLLWPALAFFADGLVLYALVLRRFDLHQLRTGAGDHWIVSGAMAVSALAGSKLVVVTAGTQPSWQGVLHSSLRVITLAALGVALFWYAVLLLCELRWPRPHYDVRRWSTVFPLAMTAVAALSTAGALGIPGLWTLGEVLYWPALSVFVVVAVGAVRRLLRPATR